MSTLTAFKNSLQGTLIFFILLLAAGCGSQKQQSELNASKAQAMAASVIPVEIAYAERQSIAVVKTFTGSLEGEEQANIVAKISERITSIKAQVGKSLVAGAVVILLDKSGASSQYYQAEAGYKNATRNLERMKSLLTEGAISQQLLDATQTAYDVAKANFDAARSAVELTTPIPGVVTALNVNIGDLTMPGAVLATLARINRMKVIFNVSEADVQNIALGQEVEVYSENRKSGAKGQVIQLSKSADIRSRSFEIRALFSNSADQWFRPGMFCKVNVKLSPRSQTLTVPISAIQSDGVTSRVYTINNGRATQQAVQTGISDGQTVEILQGLTEHDKVVTIGATNLRDSSLVSIANKAN